VYGDILRIDLTTEKVTREPIPREIIRKYVGGEGINDWLLWEHFSRVDPRIDPLSEGNVLILGLGPLGGTCFGQGSKMKFTFKGVTYNMFGDSVAGGAFGAKMRWAGHDYVVITGRAKRPSYIFISNDAVELRDASRLKGKATKATHQAIREEIGDEEVDTACIGPAGENGVTFASITTSGWRSAARTGGGAVMGSKNLKAIAVRGTKGIPVHDPRAFFQASKDMFDRLSGLPITEAWKREGTLMAIETYNQVGSNPWRNSQGIVLPADALAKLQGSVYRSLFKVRPLACSPGCSTACSAYHRVQGHETPLAKKYIGPGDKPEYLTVASFGAMCDIRDYAAMNHYYTWTSDLAADFLELGNICGFLMELWDRGLITARDMQEWTGEPITMEWGNAEAVDKVIESIAFQRNRLGEIFKGGVYKGAQKLEQIKGMPLLKYVTYAKGGSVINEELRPFPTWMTNMAVSSRGCCHLKAVTLVDKTGRQDVSQALLGNPGAGIRFTPDMKGALSAITECVTAAYNCLGVCILVAVFDPINLPPGTHIPGYTSLTGIPLTAQELYLAGQRAYNLEKAFNSRLGYTRKDDKVCERWMKEPLADPGPTPKGMKAEDYLEHTLTEYYQWHGWDPQTGLQTREGLEKLEMKEVADLLEREGALARVALRR